MRTFGALVVAASASVLAHDPITTKVTWDREIAPIVQARCAGCHAAGGRAPMSLATYEDARPWARAIREEVLARRMPKWHAVRGYGDFRNDPSLSAFEIALITAWADGGAPKSSKGPALRAAVDGSGRSGAGVEAAPVQGALRADSREVVLTCASQPLPRGLLYALRPRLAEGASLRLTLNLPDGTAAPLLWVRDFDPGFPDRYDLRVPVLLPRGARLRVDTPVDDGCRVALSIGQSDR